MTATVTRAEPTLAPPTAPVEELIATELTLRGLTPLAPEWAAEVRAAARRCAHAHSWLVSTRLLDDHTEVQDCACGARRYVRKNRDGSEDVMPQVPAGSSVENAVLNVVV